MNKFENINPKLLILIGKHDDLYYKQICKGSEPTVALGIIKTINQKSNFNTLGTIRSNLTSKLIVNVNK